MTTTMEKVRFYVCSHGHRFGVVTEAGLPPLNYCPGCGQVEEVSEITFQIGYSAAHFESRNRWGGSKRHAVDPDTVQVSRHGVVRYGVALCGLGVTTGVGDFDIDSVLACKRCAKAVHRRTTEETAA